MDEGPIESDMFLSGEALDVKSFGEKVREQYSLFTNDVNFRLELLYLFGRGSISPLMGNLVSAHITHGRKTNRKTKIDQFTVGQ